MNPHDESQAMFITGGEDDSRNVMESLSKPFSEVKGGEFVLTATFGHILWPATATSAGGCESETEISTTVPTQVELRPGSSSVWSWKDFEARMQNNDVPKLTRVFIPSFVLPFYFVR